MKSFDEWYVDARQHNSEGFTNRDFYEAGQQSKQAEVDALQKQIDDAIKKITEFNSQPCNHAIDDYYYLVEYLNEILKGESNED